MSVQTAGSEPITFFGGKGGVGKTTMAGAFALGQAAAGLRTLLISTDPAHSLADVLGTPLGDTPTEIVAGLWVWEPDGEDAVRRRVAEVVEDAHSVVPAEIMPAVQRHLRHATQTPGMVESALADQLMGAMERVPEEFDCLVVDSAPTGQLLRMVSLPSLLTPWVQGLARHRDRARRAEALAVDAIGGDDPDGQTDPLLQRLHARRIRLETTARRLREESEVRLVLLPRRMVLAETQRARRQLEEAGLRLGPVALNQVPVDADPAILAEVRERFGDCGLIEQPLLAQEPTGVQRLRDLS
ncbi:ArsA family ATPase [Lipingzhangella sp. LS1_29]|uniref:ArsA family ATPase n=1 Tax=Lipingzhangella rawalii TaxID=2055835 RepID=A0ABU2H1Q6_9ACTN|nr:ArsA family ATPase [Lipingzhangella rawalii]MDS1269223.1 ArsA family ATPase [Lipingzhangella rawalii]